MKRIEVIIDNLQKMLENSRDEEDEAPWMDEYGGFLTSGIDCHPVFADSEPCLNDVRGCEIGTMEFYENCQECKYKWLMEEYE